MEDEDYEDETDFSVEIKGCDDDGFRRFEDIRVAVLVVIFILFVLGSLRSDFM